MKGVLKTYRSNADLYVGDNYYHIDYDFQDSEFFENDEEVRKWAIDCLDGIAMDNYAEVLDELITALDTLKKVKV